MFSSVRESVPTDTLQICARKSVRRFGVGVGAPSNDSEGNRTWSNVVIEWSSGLAPFWTGRGREITPGHI